MSNEVEDEDVLALGQGMYSEEPASNLYGPAAYALQKQQQLTGKIKALDDRFLTQIVKLLLQVDFDLPGNESAEQALMLVRTFRRRLQAACLDTNNDVLDNKTVELN